MGDFPAIPAIWNVEEFPLELLRNLESPMMQKTHFNIFLDLKLKGVHLELPRGEGASMYDDRKILGFFDPLPHLLTVTNHFILFLSSAFGGPPPLPSADVIYGSPLTDRRVCCRVICVT